MLISCDIPIVIADYRECVPSLWIALFESLFQTRIKGLKTRTDYFHNLTLLLRKLEKFGSVSLRYLNVDKLIEKERASIDRMTDLFWELYLAIEDHKIQTEENEWKSRLDEFDVPRLSGSNSGSGSIELPNMTHDLTSILPEGPLPTLIDEATSPDLSESVSIPSLRQIESESIPSKFPSSSSNILVVDKPIETSRIRVKRKEEVKEWLTTVRDDIEQFEKKQTQSKPARKQLRFESPKIHVQKLESPYLHSLRLRRSSIARKKPLKNKPSSTLENILRLHQKIHEDPGVWKNQAQSSEKNETGIDNSDFDDIEDLLSAIEPNTNVELSLPERNLDKYMNQIKKTIPIPEIPHHETEKAWKSQLMTTKRALEARLWTQKVQTQRAMKNLNNMDPLVHVVSDIRKSRNIQEKKQEHFELQNAKRNIQEQYRRLKLMEHQSEKSQELVKRQQKKEYLKRELVNITKQVISRFTGRVYQTTKTNYH
jgi:hypothetical protein